MIEDNNNQNGQPTAEQEQSDDTQVKYREISKDELKQILEDHKKWVESEGKEGQRAELSQVNLEKADLSGVNLKESIIRWSNLKQAYLENTILQNAHIEETNLQEANLWEADLEGAYFDYSDFQKATLWGAKLNKTVLKNANLSGARLDRVQGLDDADLQYANLEGATGLLGNEFAQADVTGTKLPDDIKEFKALEIVEKTSQNARKIFFAMLLGCVYSWLTIATTTDVRLLTNTASSPLPIIGTEIPIAWFYITAPLVLIALYFYFHLYLDNLWEELAGLPAYFPDGKRIDQRAYPWLLVTLVRKHFKRLKERPLIAKIKEWITIFLAWWVVPITMIAFWLRYIPRHDWWGTIFHIGLIVVSVAFAIYFYRLCALTLKGNVKNVFRFQNFWKDRRFYYGVTVILVGVLFSMVSYGAIAGVKSNTIEPIRSSFRFRDIDIKKLIPIMLAKVGYDVFANLSEKVVSEIPSNFGLILKDERLDFVKGANLSHRNLNRASLDNSFLVKADFRRSSLISADLSNANLQNSNFQGANLDNASLVGANLQQAKLQFAFLKQANLENANLRGASLSLSNLQLAFLGNANLQEADLQNINQLWKKSLSINQLSKVKTLYKAKLDPELLQKVKECCPHLLEKPKKKQINKMTITNDKRNKQ